MQEEYAAAVRRAKNIAALQLICIFRDVMLMTVQLYFHIKIIRNLNGVQHIMHFRS